MATDPDKLSGAEEYIAAEFALAEPLDPEQEKKLRDALKGLDAQAFDSCDIDPKKIFLSYDPTRTSKKELLQLIKEAGGKLEHVESESSPLL
jgi:copper chaperone CopZ